MLKENQSNLENQANDRTGVHRSKLTRDIFGVQRVLVQVGFTVKPVAQATKEQAKDLERCHSY
ncbi:hypothetical protein ABID29_001000 [Streptococcus rupicaprae]|uniref:Transposase n=1 Tax=Streptococcus rupicaprae TaxID=759619 RepID=A0ABV2FH43_9STRE